MKNITLKDCKELRAKFDEYCETAEQHQFPLLTMIDIKMSTTMDNISEIDQSELNAMFRSISRIIGEDYKEYLE